MTSPVTNGQFIPFLNPFIDKHGVEIDAKLQALSILIEAMKNLSEGFPGTAITYSANYSQTIMIRQTYDAGGWQTNIVGSNQASVMTEMEKEMASTLYSSLHGKLHIAPITTIPSDPNDIPAWLTILESDMSSIENLLKNNWIVLGWQNQSSFPEFAHADKKAKGVVSKFPSQVHDYIQNTLSQFAITYPKL